MVFYFVKNVYLRLYKIAIIKNIEYNTYYK